MRVAGASGDLDPRVLPRSIVLPIRNQVSLTSFGDSTWGEMVGC